MPSQVLCCHCPVHGGTEVTCTRPAGPAPPAIVCASPSPPQHRLPFLLWCVIVVWLGRQTEGVPSHPTLPQGSFVASAQPPGVSRVPASGAWPAPAGLCLWPVSWLASDPTGPYCSQIRGSGFSPGASACHLLLGVVRASKSRREQPASASEPLLQNWVDDLCLATGSYVGTRRP